MTEHTKTDYIVQCTLDGEKYEKEYVASSEEKAMEMYRDELTEQYPKSNFTVTGAKLVKDIKKAEAKEAKEAKKTEDEK